MRKLAERTLFQGNWLTLKETLFEAEDGREFRWESVERQASRTVVVVMARLIPSDRIILVRQYRPAVGQWVLGFPAGVLEGQDREVTALQELREETGYVGRIVGESPMLKLNSGIMDEDCCVFQAEVDENDPANQVPRQDLEREEEIEPVAVPRGSMARFLEEEADRGVRIASGLWYAFGDLSRAIRRDG
jgi:ADP-ribose pyrophosphatase